MTPRPGPENGGGRGAVAAERAGRARGCSGGVGWWGDSVAATLASGRPQSRLDSTAGPAATTPGHFQGPALPPRRGRDPARDGGSPDSQQSLKSLLTALAGPGAPLGPGPGWPPRQGQRCRPPHPRARRPRDGSVLRPGGGGAGGEEGSRPAGPAAHRGGLAWCPGACPGPGRGLGTLGSRARTLSRPC